ncbi:Transglutaminase-like enzyme, putative cysteine protease [Rhodoblastus acidophilus]|uniref:Transglutaminase-like enzyme, putative cysteine protease n=1 Tax=Rhodoblastus acidophilus TaxID=1074 RepID=A0A212PXZ1_RHOAC|nr:transglutaminase family protein [Rhodoblastus acidophilus]PPQ38752.1 transglutaminase family protein [Rhodoblastus acidophilus]RAI20780.1 transglutaminase family protein [Rhodoblastus acidophilus]SNB51936.1 Transglutaminase-like enzyme, putative cysteine protease [Rhodoblastus acidophilus]
MLIEAGFDIAFDCPAQTPMLLQLNVHPSREPDLLTPDRIRSDPAVPQSAYVDLFGNRVTRLEVPPGRITFSNRFTIADSGEADPTPPDGALTPISALPDAVLLYLTSSRYCDSDKLSDFAWSHFGKVAGGARRVQAICDFVHDKIRFSYPDARPTRCASDSLDEGVGVCRDFAHLAIALCRCMNIPARYATGYLGDIGVPPDPAPMDFSAWFEAFLEGRWYTFDARHNQPRIGRVAMGYGRDAADVPLTTAFGVATLVRFEVVTRASSQQGRANPAA